VTARPPASVRGAGLIVAVQGAAGLMVAAILLFRAFGGADQRVANGFGTALWFTLAGGAVLAAGWALLKGRRWGRGLAVFAQLLLLPVAWYLAVGSHRMLIGVPVGVLALTGLALLFSPAALRWVSRGDQPGPANSANSGPDSR
jgi:peptidoglycan/LPS O-acetylase OafA/YrhL